MKKKVSLDDVFNAESVAIVGVSGGGTLGFVESVMIGTLEAGCKKVFPVNPKYKEVFGFPCYPDLKSIPEKVDHVIVSIPASGALELLRDCAEKGVNSVHFFTAGFSESGRADRLKLEQSMLAIAESAGFRIIGPNCVGLHVPKSRQATMFGVSHEPGNIAFISQSGGHAQNMVKYGDGRGLRFSKVVSYGNGLDINEIELLDYFATDPETDFIAIYIEGTRNGGAFKTALKNASARKPLVIYKGGQSEAGKRATFGHTASMTSSIDVFRAVCRQANAVQTDSLEEMIDLLTVLYFVKTPPVGKGVVLVGGGGGPSVYAGDVMEKEGLFLPTPTDRQREALQEVLPLDGSIFANPLDASNLGSPEAVQQTLTIMGDNPEVHMLVYHMGFHPITQWGLGRFGSEDLQKAFAEALSGAGRKCQKPVFVLLRPPGDLDGMKEFLGMHAALTKAGLPVFYEMEKFARAMVRVINRQQTINNKGDS
jgi:acetate---CoA ligase (ADP-forming)